LSLFSLPLSFAVHRDLLSFPTRRSSDLLWTRKNLVRLGGFLEFFGRIGAVVDVRMKPAGLFPVRLLDVFGGGVPVNPEQVVIVLSHASSQLWPSVALWFLALTEGTAYITGNSIHRGHCSRIVHAQRSHRA